MKLMNIQKKDANDKTNVKEEKKINDEKGEKIGEKIQNKISMMNL